MPYTRLMEITTIRVEKAVRDRLAARAARHDRSLGSELDAMLCEADWRAIEVAYQQLAERPEAQAQYIAEAESWAGLDLDDLAFTAAEEYPEYNR